MRLKFIELILIITALILALVLILQISVLNEIGLLQRLLFASLNLLFISFIAIYVYRVIGDPEAYFTNISLNAPRESGRRVIAKLLLDVAILPSLTLSLYAITVKLTIGFGGNTLIYILQPALSMLLACSLYSTLLVALTIVFRNIVLSSVVTGLAATIIVFYDSGFINQLILMEKPCFHTIVVNAVVLAIILLVATTAASRCRY